LDALGTRVCCCCYWEHPRIAALLAKLISLTCTLILHSLNTYSFSELVLEAREAAALLV
jgi:hypothetical protein